MGGEEGGTNKKTTEEAVKGEETVRRGMRSPKTTLGEQKWAEQAGGVWVCRCGHGEDAAPQSFLAVQHQTKTAQMPGQ